MYMRQVRCNKDCRKCKKYGSAQTDDKGYHFWYECLKYNEAINLQDIDKEKVFLIPN